MMKFKEEDVVYVPCKILNVDETCYHTSSNGAKMYLSKEWLEQNAIQNVENNLEHYNAKIVKEIATKTLYQVFDEYGISYDKQAINMTNYDYKVLHDWLLQPYKPKYKLTKVEKDMLESINFYRFDKTGLIFVGSSNDFIVNMKAKGYFKNIPTDIPISEILENCEVVE